MNPRGHWPANFVPLEPVTSGCQISLTWSAWDDGIGRKHRESIVGCVSHGRLGTYQLGPHAADDARRIFREHVSA